jgi:hypothetical protein
LGVTAAAQPKCASASPRTVRVEDDDVGLFVVIVNLLQPFVSDLSIHLTTW